MSTIDPVMTIAEIIDAQREIKTPFCLKVNRPEGSQSELHVESILRLLPAKRVVAKAFDNGKPVLLKIFLGRSADKYATRERMGVQAINQCGVKTPDLLWEGDLKDGHVLAFEFLSDTVSLYDRWERASEAIERLDILAQVVKIISCLHAHGVVQTDIHLDNFLMSAGEIYTIDGGSIERQSSGPLPESASSQNLALFFAQLYPRYDAMIGQAFQQYESSREWKQNETRVQVLRREVEVCREVRKKHYIKKIFRETTRFICHSSFNRFEVYERAAVNDELSALIQAPDIAIESGATLKSGNLSTVALVHHQDRSLVIKRYNIKNLPYGFKKAFQKSAAWYLWRSAHYMEFLGIPSLKPIALIANRGNPLRSTTYIITEYLDGRNASEHLFNMEKQNGELKAIADILNDLSSAKVSLGKLSAASFLMTAEGPRIINLDGIREYNSQSEFAHAFSKDLEYFMASWQENSEVKRQLSELLQDLLTRYDVKT